MRPHLMRARATCGTGERKPPLGRHVHGEARAHERTCDGERGTLVAVEYENRGVGSCECGGGHARRICTRWAVG